MKQFNKKFIILGLIITNLLALVPARVLASPSVSVTPSSGARGTIVTVTGSNFTSYAGDLLFLSMDNQQVTNGPVLVPQNGSFTLSFPVPVYAGPGNVAIRVKNEEGAILSETTFTIIVPQVRLNTWGGAVGTAITVLCKGFYVKELVTFSYKINGEWSEIATQKAGETGECSLDFVVPSSPEGSHTIKAESVKGGSATAEFDVIPSISVSPPTAAVGDKVAVIGTGFTAEDEVVVTLHGNRVAYAQTYERGSFTALFIVPVLKAGTYVIGIQGANREQRWEELTLITRIALDKTNGDIGDKLTLTGSGFEVSHDVVVSYDSENIMAAITDEAGAFQASFNVPISPAGSHVVTVADGTTTRQLIFTVESEAPPAPTVMTPKNKEITTQPLSLDWEGIYDPSEPVVYTIQIARSAAFDHNIFEKSGVTATQYTLTSGESLPPNRRWNYYYWRVRATDSAANVGEWSASASFRVKPTDILPAWSRYLLILGMILIVLMLLYFVRKGLSTGKKPAPTPDSK